MNSYLLLTCLLISVGSLTVAKESHGLFDSITHLVGDFGQSISHMLSNSETPGLDADFETTGNNHEVETSTASSTQKPSISGHSKSKVSLPPFENPELFIEKTKAKIQEVERKSKSLDGPKREVFNDLHNVTKGLFGSFLFNHNKFSNKNKTFKPILLHGSMGVIGHLLNKTDKLFYKNKTLKDAKLIRDEAKMDAVNLLLENSPMQATQSPGESVDPNPMARFGLFSSMLNSSLGILGSFKDKNSTKWASKMNLTGKLFAAKGNLTAAKWLFFGKNKTNHWLFNKNKTSWFSG